MCGRSIDATVEYARYPAVHSCLVSLGLSSIMESMSRRQMNAAAICSILLLVRAQVIASTVAAANTQSGFRTWHPLKVSLKNLITHPLANDQTPVRMSDALLDRPTLDHAEQKFQAWLEYINRTSSDPFEKEKADLISRYAAARHQVEQDDSSDREPMDPFDYWDNSDMQTNSTERNKLKPRMRIKVAKDGSGDVRSIQEAVDRVPRNFNDRVVIDIKAGVYREKVRIHKDKPYITLRGDRRNRTTITYDSIASDTWGKRHTPLRTYQSATVAVNSKFFIAKNIVFQNSAPIPAPGAIGKQAVAFRISADMAAFYHCKFLGSQDTLYDHHGRHYFKNCYIEGTIDFVFGNGRSLYKNCHLNALNNSGQVGSLTAQRRNEATLDTGFSFVDSRITGAGQAYLGRAWGNDSRVVFAYSYMDSVVVPVGWNDWGLYPREKTAYYAEFRCTGPGAAKLGLRANWVRMLSKGQAKPFLSSAFINGKYWLPSL